MAHTIRDKSKLLARVRRLKGQLNALEKQLDSAAECDEVLQQIAAIRGAVNGLMGAVLEGHFSDHLVNETDLQKRQQESVAVLQVIKSYLK